MVAHVIAVLFTCLMIFVAWPGSSLFSWHPTLMTFAFVTLMFEGLLVFNRESSLLLAAARQTKVQVHWILQATAITCAILGFLVIFYNKYLYDKPHFTTWHGLFGVITVSYIVLQSIGGSFVKYQWLRSFINIKLADLKLYHATSGLIAFTLVTATLMLAMYSTWFTSNVNEILWYGCVASVSFMAVIVMNQITSEYLPKARGQKPVPVPTEVASKNAKTTKKSKANN